MYSPGLFPWKEAPFIRLFLPFFAGILFGWYGDFSSYLYWLVAGLCIAGLAGLSRLSLSFQFRWRTVTGLLLHGLLFMAGTLLTYYREVSHDPQWLSYHYRPGDGLLVSLEEPVTEKAKTYKTIATVKAVIKAGEVRAINGKLLLYFPKDSIASTLCYGTQLLINKPPEAIRYSGNPGAFNYAQYCATNGIFHQVYLRQYEYCITGKNTGNTVKSILYRTREKVLNIIRENIPGKKQAGLAEALLIGYKDELDGDLLQSYTDTGVVHIIAVSGLHLGLIYGVLLVLCKPLRRQKAKWLSPVVIITGLWLFAFLAGGTASVLRSAIMFSCLAIGEQLRGKVSVYNSLAASAFLLLCYDPAWWRDAGFLLSYTAVLSILLFTRPIQHLIFIQNRLLYMIWKAVAVTIAAQLLTTPIILYYFHQFPNLFLLTNLVAVPLSSLILLGELALCALSWIPALGKIIGWALYWLIRGLNGFVEWVQQIPFNSTTGLQLSGLQLLLLYTSIGCLAGWLLWKRKVGLPLALAAGWLFLLTSFYGRREAAQQRKLIIYNVPKHQAIDFIQGRQYAFRGDSLLQDTRQQQYHLQPSRTLYRVTAADSLDNLLQHAPFYCFGNCSLLVIDKEIFFKQQGIKVPVDHIVLSHNARVSVKELTTVFHYSSIIIDASNSRWKTSSWKEECRQLGIACHSVADEGAFVLTLH
jgi:competence protein ComEC